MVPCSVCSRDLRGILLFPPASRSTYGYSSIVTTKRLIPNRAIVLTDSRVVNHHQSSGKAGHRYTRVRVPQKRRTGHHQVIHGTPESSQLVSRDMSESDAMETDTDSAPPSPSPAPQTAPQTPNIEPGQRPATPPNRGIPAANITTRASAARLIDRVVQPTLKPAGLQNPTAPPAVVVPQTPHPPRTTENTPGPGPLGIAVNKAAKILQQRETAKINVLRCVASSLDELRKTFRGLEKEVFQSLEPHLIEACQSALLGNQDKATPMTTTMEPGQKAAPAPRAAPNTFAKVAAANPPPPTTAMKSSSATQKKAPAANKKAKDSRIFIRIPADSPAREHSPWALRGKLNSLFQKDLFREVRTTPTGFAIFPRSDEGAKALVENIAKIAAALGQCQVERAADQYAYIVPRVPTRLRGMNGEGISLTQQIAADEVTHVTGLKPVRLILLPSRESDPTVRPVLVVLPKAAPAFRLFGCSGSAEPKKDKAKVAQCANCWGFHDSRSCSGSRRCVNCAGDCPAETPCANHTVCRNCSGPHKADTTSCPLRPSIKDGRVCHPTLKEKQKIRRAHRTKQEAETNTTTSQVNLTTPTPPPATPARGHRFDAALTAASARTTAESSQNPQTSSTCL